ncbi:unnamed protein product, partial [Meganyctiphanes norvegica]
MNILLANNANVNATDDQGETALHLAARNNYQEACELLLRWPGVDAAIECKEGKTPEYVAVYGDNIELAKILRARADGPVYDPSAVDAAISQLRPETRGICYVLNNYKFTSQEEKDFPGGENDGRNLQRVFTNLKYNVILLENLTKYETERAFNDIQQNKGLKDVNVNIFYILSHGSDTTTFLSYDCQYMDLMDLMVMFRKDNCLAMANKPQLWFGDFCRGSDIQRDPEISTDKDVKSNTEVSTSKDVKFNTETSESDAIEVLSHALYFMSSSPGIVSHTDEHGSSFTTTFCKMLEERRYQLDGKWITDLTDKLENGHNPTTASTFYYPFPGKMFYPNEFSLDYDIKKINRK